MLNLAKRGIVLLFLFRTSCVWSENQTRNNVSFCSINISYKGDLTSSFSGGLKTGSTYLGLVDLSFEFSTEKAGLWRGGTLMIHGENSQGGQPSANYVGDFQGVDNIDACGSHTFMYELWYSQTIKNLSITAGLQDLSATFAYSDVAGIFINSSFGIHSVMATNFASPIYPLTSMGITFCWDAPDHNWGLKGAFFKGCPLDFNSNPHNLTWDCSHKHGKLLVGEAYFQWSGSEGKVNITKLGMFYHHHDCEDKPEQETESGFYLVGDNQLTPGKHAVSLFYQLAVSPNQNNSCYMGAGLNYHGIFSPKKKNDEMGLAVGRACLKNTCAPKDETTIELTYHLQLTTRIYIQPDIQYICHPAGTGEDLPNATFGLVRLGIDL